MPTWICCKTIRLNINVNNTDYSPAVARAAA